MSMRIILRAAKWGCTHLTGLNRAADGYSGLRCKNLAKTPDQRTETGDPEDLVKELSAALDVVGVGAAKQDLREAVCGVERVGVGVAERPAPAREHALEAIAGRRRRGRSSQLPRLLAR